MKSKVLNISSYTFSKNDAFLLDTNIWLFIYGRQVPGNKDWRIPLYSKALANILASKSRIFIDVLVLSEFVNRYSRIEYNIIKDSAEKGEFKSFRQSSKFKSIAEDIARASRRILGHCERTENGFESIDIDILLSDFEMRCPDFNDQILAELCKTRSFKLVTHDGDFKDCGITLLTANKRLLSK